MAIIPDFFLNAVVALGIDGGDGKKHWIGTGFIVGRKEIDNPNLSTYYIITNKHVIEQEKYVYVRFNSLGGELVKDYRINLYDSMSVPMFSAHPHDKTDSSGHVNHTSELITVKAVKETKMRIYPQGTLLMAMYGQGKTRGTVAILEIDAAVNQACAAITVKDGKSKFLFYQLKNSYQDIRKLSNTGNQENLNADIIKTYQVPWAPDEEQERISTILTTQDKVIELKEKRLAEKQRQKKYLMQQLLTGKKRLPGFSGEWKNIKLCEVLSERKEKNVEQNLRICSVAVQKGVVDQVEHLGRSYAANDTSNYSVAHYGDIIYTKSPTGDFLYGIVKQNLLQETVAVSPLYGVFTPLTFGLGYFLHTYFQSAICARNYLLPIVQKGAKNTINITNDTFISSKLYLPLDVEEQKAIADTFIAADREIELLQQDIEQEKQKKKALMQLLLTGIVRVKT